MKREIVAKIQVEPVHEKCGWLKRLTCFCHSVPSSPSCAAMQHLTHLELTLSQSTQVF